MNPRTYRYLKVWQKAMELALEAYSLTRSFPDSERYGLVSQIRRAGVSVPANIAEGHAMGAPKAFVRHRRIASGSLAEVETELMLAQELEYVENSRIANFLERSGEVRRMLFGLKKSLEREMESGD